MSQVSFGPRDLSAAWVLILAPVEDGHARAVARVIANEHNIRAVIWDARDFPATDTMTLALSGGYSILEILSDVVIGDFAKCLSVWWRRPGQFKLDAKLTDARIRDYCHAECVTFFKSALLASGVRVINDPLAELAARKPLQLALAATFQLEIPDTLMTNSPDRVRDFWEKHSNGCIYKTFTAPTWRMAETRVLTEMDLQDLATLRHAPIIIQELVPKLCDVRATIIDDKCFAASVTSSRPEAELDWRMDVAAQWSEHVLPEVVVTRLMLLLRRLGLVYGAVDLRQRPDSEYTFLEVNPSGQYLFVELATSQPITFALAELLVNAKRSNSRSATDLGSELARPAKGDW